MLTVIILRLSGPWTSLASAAKNWVSVNNTSFCVLDSLFATSTCGGWKFSLLFSCNDPMMSFLTVLNYPGMRWVVSDCNRFA